MRPPSIPTTIPVNRDDSKQVVIMKSLYNSLIEYREPKTHRILIHFFMCLPPRKDFPDYFNVIDKPIAMNKIRERIEKQQYPDEKACLDDFKLMFSNCKFFNEEGSQIFNDAVFLEKLLLSRREQLLNEHNRPSRDSKDAAKEAILNGNNTDNATTKASANDLDSSSPNISPKKEIATINGSSTTSSVANVGSSSNNNRISNIHTSTTDQKTTTPTTPSKSSNLNNGVPKQDTITQQSDSTDHSSTADQQNNGADLEDSTRLKINHNHHNDTSMDSISNLSADILASTPVEKCSLNTRRGRNADAPKRQLLTGYIIYASEIRKDVIDKNPNQNFGDISRLVGNMWKALAHDIRSKYDQRALIHNKKVRERAQRELSMTPDGRLLNGLHTPKLTKRKLAKLAKEQMRQHHLSISRHDDSSTLSPRIGQEHSSSMVSQTPSSTYKHLHPQHSQPQTTTQTTTSRQNTTVESSTQTTAFRFVEPPTKKRLVYSESFRKYIESLQVPNKDLLAEETAPERPAELPTHWLGAGIGRHESPEAALWALRDFMLQDSVTMRRNMEPYLTPDTCTQ